MDIKRFETFKINEDKKADIKTLSEEYLIDLVDDGFKVIVKKDFERTKNVFEIDIRKNASIYNMNNQKGRFSWDIIKDKIISFIEMLEHHHTILYMNLYFDNYLDYQLLNNEYDKMGVKDLKSGKYIPNKEISLISICIKF